ncbi:L-threonylcarbamoyladenylate synthase [Bathymodiolus septemdierum thioautotrophic gill symbiont]|uniref:L-threonylcarbamoyladenylate synthase n=1 Tax=endosymbiont of Bathymodiolus septemdierum str. Myojin knoll TaxID=1303921 RepID=A0A0N7KBG5_9GAMM|nr:Sua5/YciO/YrdC/YwlC family protein [Bathymodiolus septemdierum thioautotrophic gill symbiont]BAS67951.1 tRNA threonylcarbamoyladenosine biosynthesis protein [endosymbiont of Bathymodiolus septemdierum str. Myojin knoll]
MNFKTRLTAKILTMGGVVSIPTDTIQGLTCLPKCQQSIQKILRLKRRSPEKGIILLASDTDLLTSFVQDADLLEKIQPQRYPTTYLLKANNAVSSLITGKFDTVGVRITDDPLIVYLCKKCNSALLSTSANISGKQAVDSALKLNIDFQQQLDFILTQNKDNGQASRIINLHTGERLR